MPSHYKSGKSLQYFSAESGTQSNIDLVIALRRTNENDQKIGEVLQQFSALTRKEIEGSLRELMSHPDDAHTALKAAAIVGCRTLVKKAAEIILATAYLSDDLKREVRQHVQGQASNPTMLGDGRAQGARRYHR